MQIRQNYGIFGWKFKKFKFWPKIPYFCGQKSCLRRTGSVFFAKAFDNKSVTGRWRPEHWLRQRLSVHLLLEAGSIGKFATNVENE
jgi:hypothetical protein